MVEAQSAGLALAVGLAGALWGASGYVEAFGRTLNRIYQVDEELTRSGSCARSCSS